MRYIAYVDESGTNDRKFKAPVSTIGILSGFVSTPDEWSVFNEAWKAVLKKYDAPYFHFYDFAEASAKIRNPRKSVFSDYEKNPYKNWTLVQLDDFFNECVMLIGSFSVVPFGAQIRTSDFYKFTQCNPQDAYSILFGNNPFGLLHHDFFQHFVSRTQLKWDGNSSDSVVFIFDQTGDVNWIESLKRAFRAYQKQDGRFGRIEFGDKRTHLPLQIADISAYRTSQVWTNLTKIQNLKISILDKMIVKNMPGISVLRKQQTAQSLPTRDDATDFVVG